MAGVGVGSGPGGIATKLDDHIQVLRYCLVCFNVILWMVGAAIFGLTMWLRFEPGLDEWVGKLELQDFYIGVYILIALSVVVIIMAFLGCAAGLSENQSLLIVFIGTQILGFILGMAGSALLLDNSTIDSRIQPMIRDSMRRLILNSGNHEPSRLTLQMVQENIGCCGADGPNDYVTLRQPLPSQCRDTVTGNAFFHGCVDELTWFFEEKAGWVCGLAMTVCFMQIINVVLSTVLIQAKKKEDSFSTFGR